MIKTFYRLSKCDLKIFLSKRDMRFLIAFCSFFFARNSNYEIKFSDNAGFLPINKLRADVLSPKVPFLRRVK